MEKNNPLGSHTTYPTNYDPTLLFPVPRDQSRVPLGIGDVLPFSGADIWTAFELSWLNAAGKPLVGIGKLIVPCDSPNLVESKSLKLYFNSLNNTRFNSEAEFVATVEKDVSRCVEALVSLSVFPVDRFRSSVSSKLPYRCIDNLDVSCSNYTPDSTLLSAHGEDVEERLVSHLLKTNCPVTGQPDWASVFIAYRGKAIDRAGLLQYLVSYRDHQDYHENCIEKIFCDLMQRCEPAELEIYGRYTRRGGLDINPYRTTEGGFETPDFFVDRQ
ncbi:MAG: NADPH-dependent 7-cyano-7-deazaguanine reductase QueF [bacterium]